MQPHPRLRHLRRWERRLAVLLSLAAHVGTLSILLLVPSHGVEDGLYTHQAPFGIAFSLMIGVVQLLSVVSKVRADSFHVVLHSVRWMILLTVGLTMGRSVHVEVLLATTFVVEVGLFYPPRLALCVTGIALATLLVVQRGAVAIEVGPVPSVFDVIVLGFTTGVVFALALLLHRASVYARRQELDVARLDRAVDNLSRANEGFQEYALVGREKAAAEERERISGDVHDTVGYTLTTIITMSRVARRLLSSDPDKTMELLWQIGEQAQDGLDETRLALRRLRKLGRTDQSGISNIHKLARGFSNATGVRVEVEFTNADWKPGSPVDDTLYHVVQESMTNAFRHGRPSTIWIRFWQDREHIILNIQDNGSPGMNGESGIGLTSMTGRVRAVGGTFEARGNEIGFKVTAVVPLRGVPA